MNFIEAMQLAKEGKKVREKSWMKDSYLQIVDGTIIDESGTDCPWTFCDTDEIDSEWEVVEDKENFAIKVEFSDDFDSLVLKEKLELLELANKIVIDRIIGVK